MNFQRGAYSSVAPPSSGSRSGGQTHPRFAPPSSSSSSSSARPQARNIRKPIKGGYFDDDDDDGDDDSGAGGGFPNTVPSNPASGAAAEDDYDPLDAFMAGVEEQVKHDEANIGKTEALPEIVSGIDDGELEYYESNRAQVSNEDSDDENVADIYDDEGNVIKKEKTRVEPLPPVDHSKIQYHSFRKCFYREHRDISSMSDADVQSLRDDFELSVQGGDVPRPIKKFEQSGLHYNLLKEIERLGFEAPTAIQAQALPIALSGRDIIGLAKTGSGKTFSFLWPMLMHVLDQPRMRSGDGPIGLVLSPTRELAAQIYTEAQKFAKIYGITVCPIYGGAGKWEMTKALKESPEIVIATPGRLIELIRSKATNLERCTMVVLDEADRMFEMGFEYQMRSIVNNIRPTRQTLLFSATMKRKVEGFAREILSEPIRIVIGSIGQANPDIKQHVEVFSSDTQKWAWLSGQADDFVADGKVLIFVGQKATAEDLAIQLKMHFRRRQLDIGMFICRRV
jgi:ATP-dependent RNA helicase DDX42